MSCQKLKTILICVGESHRSATTKIYGDKTSRGSKVLFGHCSICNRKISMTIGDNTIIAEILGNFFKKVGKNGLNVSINGQKVF